MNIKHLFSILAAGLFILAGCSEENEVVRGCVKTKAHPPLGFLSFRNIHRLIRISQQMF